jgi:hypothetical protein
VTGGGRFTLTVLRRKGKNGEQKGEQNQRTDKRNRSVDNTREYLP